MYWWTKLCWVCSGLRSLTVIVFWVVVFAALAAGICAGLVYLVKEVFKKWPGIKTWFEAQMVAMGAHQRVKDYVPYGLGMSLGVILTFVFALAMISLCVPAASWRLLVDGKALMVAILITGLFAPNVMYWHKKAGNLILLLALCLCVYRAWTMIPADETPWWKTMPAAQASTPTPAPAPAPAAPTNVITVSTPMPQEGPGLRDWNQMVAGWSVIPYWPQNMGRHQMFYGAPNPTPGQATINLETLRGSTTLTLNFKKGQTLYVYFGRLGSFAVKYGKHPPFKVRFPGSSVSVNQVSGVNLSNEYRRAGLTNYFALEIEATEDMSVEMYVTRTN